MKRTFFSLSLFALCFSLGAQQRQQDRVNPSMYTYPAISTRTEVILPRVNGYNVIKADLHVHTIYSDGNLTSAARITEAWQDGLDAIAITDHIEVKLNVGSFKKFLGNLVVDNKKAKKDEKVDMNSHVEGARGMASRLGITLIPGIEITRNPREVGHFNALFTTDNNLIPDEDPLQAIRNAKKQNAIVQINHPGWARTNNDYTATAETAIKEGLIDGVEVFNSYEFYPEVIERAVAAGHYVCCGSDLHITSNERYGHYGKLRDMTLIFAKDSSLASIREALEARRTLAYAYGDIAGSEELLKDFFRAACSVKVVSVDSKGRKRLQITNNSSFPYILKLPDSTVDYTLEGFSSIIWTVRGDDLPVTVSNMWYGDGKHPSVTLGLTAACGKSGEPSPECFANPPSEARPRVWWHWEDGNITKDGIRKDLEWMKRVGIGGYHHFDAGLSQDPVVKNRFIYMHEDWKDAFRYAIRLSDSLGFTVGIASSPGWSNTGGPWVSRDDAMKKLVWTALDVEKGHLQTILPEPEKKQDYYRDIRVVAFKLPETDGAVRSIKVLGNNKRPKWNIMAYKWNLVLEASDDGKTFREVTRIPQTCSPSITVNFPPVKAAEFRLRDLDGNLDIPYVLYTRSRVQNAEDKAGFSSPYDLNDFPTVIPDDEPLAELGTVTDLTSKMSEDGRLEWDVPDGRWRILRIGYTLTGKQNGPAPKEATGLEVDKFDRDAYRRYFNNYLNLYRDATDGMMGARGITEILVDSYEAGWQTWTPAMFEEFESRRGYSLLPWLPALTGEILGSAVATEKFLFDWRTTLSDLYRDTYAQVKDIAASYGIGTVCLESQEDGRVFVADGMGVKRNATVPMAACWTLVDKPTSHSTYEMAVSDMRESASVAHLYGKQWVAAESFTADGLEQNALAFTPGKLKRLADTEFASGVNRIFVHESSHQPLDDCRPGIGLNKYGQWFCRHETWAEQAKPWMDYIARTSYMLSRGSNVADILVYYGEDTNITARYGKALFPVPLGYNYDFVNPDGLFDLKVEGGRIVAPSGVSYALLCVDIAGLPQTERVRMRLEELQAMGANVCDVKDLSSAIVSVSARDVESPSGIRFVHRKTAASDIYWLDNPTDSTVCAEITFRCGGMVPVLWNPENGEIHALSYRTDGETTTIPLEFNADDAFFVVFGAWKASAERKPEMTAGRIELKSWTLAFPQRTIKLNGLQDYTASKHEDVKYFSGTCVYTSEFELDTVPPDAELDLGRVCDLCELKVNGQDIGVLWRAPFKASVGKYLKKGRNVVEVRLVNVWVNRLIGDAQPGCRNVTTYTTRKFYNAESPLLPAGLLGPVVLRY